MGKAYFEFLEEEFQVLMTALQKSLATYKDDDKNNNNNTTSIATQFTRCRAVLQQLRAEAAKDDAFQERLALYKIQYTALDDHWQELQKQQQAAQKQEITFSAFGPPPEQL